MPPSRWQLFNYIIHISVCQQLFSTFYKFFQTSLCISLSFSEQLIYYTTDLGFVNPYFSYFKSFVALSVSQTVFTLYSWTAILSIDFLDFLFSRNPAVLYIIPLFYIISMVIFYFSLSIIFLWAISPLFHLSIYPFRQKTGLPIEIVKLLTII